MCVSALGEGKKAGPPRAILDPLSLSREPSLYFDLPLVTARPDRWFFQALDEDLNSKH